MFSKEETGQLSYPLGEFGYMRYSIQVKTHLFLKVYYCFMVLAVLDSAVHHKVRRKVFTTQLRPDVSDSPIIFS